MVMKSIIDLLAEGDLRTVGRVSEIIKLVTEKPELISEVIQSMTNTDPGIRMRASDAVEKITRTKPEFLQP
jgi:hypothetical protein